MIPSELIPHFTRNLLDPSNLYQAAKEIDNYSGRGTYNLAAARAIKYYWLPHRQFFYEPLSTRDQLKTVADVNYTLAEAYAEDYKLDHVSLSFRCFDSARKAPKGILSLPKSGERELEPHAVAVVGYDYTNGNILFVNSWGRSWGDNGYGEMPPEYFDRYAMDVWLGRNARYGWTIEKHRKNDSPLSPRAFAREWSIENPRWRKRFYHNGRGHQWVLYDTISATGSAAEIIDIRNGFGLRVGWAHLFHLRGAPEEREISVLKELYVWPSFREQGYGTLLEAMAVYRAQVWRSRKLQILFHNIDAFPHVRATGRLFAQQRGYEWKWRATLRPMLEAIAEKRL